MWKCGNKANIFFTSATSLLSVIQALRQCPSPQLARLWARLPSRISNETKLLADVKFSIHYFPLIHTFDFSFSSTLFLFYIFFDSTLLFLWFSPMLFPFLLLFCFVHSFPLSLILFCSSFSVFFSLGLPYYQFSILFDFTHLHFSFFDFTLIFFLFCFCSSFSIFHCFSLVFILNCFYAL